MVNFSTSESFSVFWLTCFQITVIYFGKESLKTQTLPSLPRYGRGLQQFSVQLEQEKGRNEANTTMLQVNTQTCFPNLKLYFTRDGLEVFVFQEAFSLLAYADPWSSPVGGQLEPSGRESVCAALNSAILGICLFLRMAFTDLILIQSPRTFLDDPP